MFDVFVTHHPCITFWIVLLVPILGVLALEIFAKGDNANSKHK